VSNVITIGDCHCPCMLSNYPDWLVSIADKYKCDRTVMIGDLVDLHCLSMHPKRIEFLSAEDEFEKAQIQVDMLVDRFPRADWLIGNHDALPMRHMEAANVPQALMAKPGKIWKTKKWRVHARYADMLIDNVIYRHGDKGKGGSGLAAVSNALNEYKSLVQGHHHAQAGVSYITNSSGVRLFGAQTGCGLDISHPYMNYAARYARKPTLGCVVVVEKGKVAIFEPFPESLI
jgi:hypothetical protein